MYKKTLSKNTKGALESLKGDFLKKFYLAGGTALALQFGHRRSIDLDFFSGEKFSPENLKQELKKISKFKVQAEDEDTLEIILNQTKISFFYYPYKLLFSKIRFQNTKLADWRDIACMKINAISQRGSKKDFIDLYFILKKKSLMEILELFNKKYKNIDYNQLHILKSLSYFEQAEQEAESVILKTVSWQMVKKNILKKIKESMKKR